MGSGDTLIGLAVVGVLAVGAYWVLSSGALQSTNAVNGDDPGFVEGGEDSESSGGSSNCKTLCADADCQGYDDEGCSAGCSACKSSGGGSSSSKGGSSVNCEDGHSCNTRCAKGWCTSYKKCCNKGNDPGGCTRCNVGARGGVTNCGDLCNRKECSSYRSKGCSGCSKCSCANLCKNAQCGSFRSAGCSGKCPCTTKGPAGTNKPASKPASKSSTKKCTSAGRSCGFNKVWKTGGGSASNCTCAAKLARISYHTRVRPIRRTVWRLSMG